MILLNDYNGFSDIMAMPLDFFWIWVEISNLSATLVTEVTVRLVGETIRSVLQVDRVGLRNGLASVRITLPLHHHVRVNKRLKVSPEDLIHVNYRNHKDKKSLKKQGRPRGSKNKKQLFKGESSSSMEAPAMPESPSTDETGGK
ncbi:hypothetical protein ACLB2K_044652 [Fragaria x ananassa]